MYKIPEAEAETYIYLMDDKGINLVRKVFEGRLKIGGPEGIVEIPEGIMEEGKKYKIIAAYVLQVDE